MVPDYDDDEIIEDYEELEAGAGVRRVNSAQGGPVKRPSGGVRPSTTAMPALQDENGQPIGPPKGKISQKSAKLIWIICIIITLAGVGLFVADAVFDAFGRGKSRAAQANNAANANTTHHANALPPRVHKSPEQIAQDEFRSAVIVMMREMDNSKAWDFYWTSVLEFNTAYNGLLDLKKQDAPDADKLKAAYAEAIKAYYKAKYAGALFKNHFDEDNVSKGYFPININSDEVTMLNKEDLKNPKIRKYQAACSKFDSRSTKVNKFHTDILKYDLQAQKVHDSKEWRDKVFGEYMDRWTAASASPPSFAQEDLDFVNGPDYKAGEKKMWDKYLEAHPPK